MAKTGASELMRSLGLLVDGPARWGAPVASRAPGIILIELPNGADSPSIDLLALRRWLDRVPSLTIDGIRPTPQQLQRRLAQDWLPGQPVLYVGRSNRAIGQRLAAIYNTKLGDAKPTSAANWLYTLANLGELRVWWAETPAHEEYTDAILEQVGGTPWANHSIEGTLRTDADEAADVKSKAVAAKAAARQAKPRAATVRKPTTPKLATKVMPDHAVLSKEGLDRLTAELNQLRDVARPEIIERVATARSLGDLRENGDYQYARQEQSFIEGRIQALEALLRNAVAADQPLARDVVQLGSTVEVEESGDKFTYKIVSTAEANIAAGRMSNASPVGRALLGARAGDNVVVQLPAGAVTYRVLKVG